MNKTNLIAYGAAALLLIAFVVFRISKGDGEKGDVTANGNQKDITYIKNDSISEIDHLREKNRLKRNGRSLYSRTPGFIKSKTDSLVDSSAIAKEEPTKTIVKTKTSKKTSYRKKTSTSSKKNSSKKYVGDPDDALVNTNENSDQGFSSSNESGNAAGFMKCSFVGDQKIKNDKPIKFITEESFSYNGITIPKHTLFSAITKYGNTRIFFSVNNLQVNGQFVNLKMALYDPDFNRGLYYENDQIQNEAKNQGKQVLNEVLNTIPGGSIISGGRRLIQRIGQGNESIWKTDGVIVYFKPITK